MFFGVIDVRFSKINKPLTIFVVASQLIFLLCATLIVSQTVSLDYHGFGVASSGTLFLGIGHKIDVYENGKLVYTIREGTSRGYCFTIQEDDTILLASGNDVYIFDLQGETTIAQWRDSTIKDTLSESKYFHKTPEGDVYRASYPMGRLTIYRNDSPIYRLPLFDYVIMILLCISVPCYLISGYIIQTWIKEYGIPWDRR